MKIAFVTPYDYPYPGGVTEHIRHLDRQFRARGHQTRIIAGSSLPQEQLEPHIIKVTGEVYSVPVNGSTARLALAPDDPERLTEILQRERFDVIHLHEPAAPFLNWSMLEDAGAVKVGTYHAYVENQKINRYIKPVSALFSYALDGRILVSPSLEGTLPKHWLGSYRIIPNGIDVGRFADPGLLTIPEFDDGRPNLLFVGRMDPRKGLEVLLRAYPAIRRAVPQVRLLVVGAIPDADKARLQGRLQREGLRDVHLVGRVSDADLPRYHRTAALLCAPSTGGESFGIVLLGAMAAGLPLVASQIAGYQSVMQHRREGLLVPPNDPDSLAEAVTLLLKDPEQRSGMAARGRVTAARYDWDTVAPQVLDYYRELIEARRGSTVPVKRSRLPDVSIDCKVSIKVKI